MPFLVAESHFSYSSGTDQMTEGISWSKRVEWSCPAGADNVHHPTNSYIPCPAFLSFPCLTSSSQTAFPNWFGGTMATMAEDWPLVVGRLVIFESSSSWVSLRRFLKALKASFNSFWVGGVGSVIGVSSCGRSRTSHRGTENV